MVCSGTHDQTAYEDVLGAGSLCDLLWANYGGGAVADSALIALRLFRLEQNDLLTAVARSRNGRRFMALPDLREDVAFCVQRDLFELVAEMGKDGVVSAQLPADRTTTAVFPNRPCRLHSAALAIRFVKECRRGAADVERVHRFRHRDGCGVIASGQHGWRDAVAFAAEHDAAIAGEVGLLRAIISASVGIPWPALRDIGRLPDALRLDPGSSGGDGRELPGPPEALPVLPCSGVGGMPCGALWDRAWGVHDSGAQSPERALFNPKALA